VRQPWRTGSSSWDTTSPDTEGAPVLADAAWRHSGKIDAEFSPDVGELRSVGETAIRYRAASARNPGDGAPAVAASAVPLPDRRARSSAGRPPPRLDRSRRTCPVHGGRNPAHAFTSDPAAALAKADQLAISEWAEALTGPMVDGFFHRAPSAAERRALLQAAGMANREAAVEAARSNARSRTFERLHEITVPTLIVQGRHDRARTPEHSAEMASQIRGAQLFVLEGSGHTPQIEEPEAFWGVALPFLAGKTSVSF
jgi:pimeloyl-ACP methyl ester carboxylesterase